MRLNRILLLVAAPVLLPALASAQDLSKSAAGEHLRIATEALRAACQADLQKYCSSISPGEGRLFFCMLAHEDKISAPCDYVIYRSVNALASVLERIEDAEVACADDIERLCVTAEGGDGEIAHCLVAKKASLSETCRAAVQKLPERQ